VHIPFVGRKAELNALKALQQKKTASLVILQGRRRIGKSRLIEHFAANQKIYCFAGIAPSSDTTAQMQRDEFARQMSEQCGVPKFFMEDWGDLFSFLSSHLIKGKIVILLDEISWMGSLDPSFLGKLKNAWDLQLKKNPQLMLVLCGSVSSWIQKNIISSTLFLGRPSLYMTLKELTLDECNKFGGKYASHISAQEKLKILAITGGVPRYLELIDPNKTAEENIRNLCFTSNAPLLNEFDYIFADIFGNRAVIYKIIVQYLLSVGNASQDDIIKACGRSKTGDFSQYLSDLELAGFLTRDYTCHLNTEKISKLSHYRLKDNYIRFYLKYILPNKAKIKKGIFEKISVTTLPAWDSMMAIQFENLVLNNDLKLLNQLGISLEDVVFINPFFQRKNKTQAGCQIGLLIQTKHNCLFVCEIKFSKQEISFGVIKEVQQKIENLKKPKNFSCRAVLIHVNGVNTAVHEADYFAALVDFGTLLEI